MFDRNRPKIDLFNYKVQNDYTTSIALGEEYASLDATVKHNNDRSRCIDHFRLTDGAGIDMTFKELVKEIRGAKGVARSLLIKDATMYYPFLGEAIDKLGFSRIESIGYSQKAIKDELLKIGDLSSEAKVSAKLCYEVGRFYSNSTIKADLRKAYDSLGYDRRAAKATDLAKYYDVRFKRPRIDGKIVEGYVIMSPHY